MSKPAALQYSQYYHIYNRGNNRENLFREERNYGHFLKLYALHIEQVAETFAYCLLKNHFHLLVRINDRDPKGFQNPSGLKVREPSQAFSNLFNAYTKAVNKAYGRTGSLFEHPFGRILVTTDAYFIQLVSYIHRNPQKHSFVTDFRDWPHSSYHAHLSARPTRLKRETVLEWYGGPARFARAHQQTDDERLMASLAPDDFD